MIPSSLFFPPASLRAFHFYLIWFTICNSRRPPSVGPAVHTSGAGKSWSPDTEYYCTACSILVSFFFFFFFFRAQGEAGGEVIVSTSAIRPCGKQLLGLVRRFSSLLRVESCRSPCWRRFKRWNSIEEYLLRQAELDVISKRDAWASRLQDSTSKISVGASSSRLGISLRYPRHERWNGPERPRRRTALHTVGGWDSDCSLSPAFLSFLTRKYCKAIVGHQEARKNQTFQKEEGKQTAFLLMCRPCYFSIREIELCWLSFSSRTNEKHHIFWLFCNPQKKIEM